MPIDYAKISNEIDSHPFAANDPRGYKQLECSGKISLNIALSKVGMTYLEVCRFNFGPSSDPDKEYEKCFDACDYYMHWEKDPDHKWKLDADGIPVLWGYSGTYIWVPGDCVISGDNADGATFNNFNSRALQDTKAGLDVPPPATDREYFAARSQVDGVWSCNTVDTGFRPGDILLSYHEGDNFISKVTLSWPTHAGIALNEKWAIDANNREEGFAVSPIEMRYFFHNKITPQGGLVYRYIGRSGDNKEDLEKIRHDAAVWAKRESWNKYKFVLTKSHIVSEKIGQINPSKTDVIEKRFDEGGRAVDKDGKQMTYEKKEPKDKTRPATGKNVEIKNIGTEFHAIYCAEFVWRAYRSGAGVNIVNPKKFTNILKESNHAIAAILRFKIGGERMIEKYVRDGENPKSKTAERLRKALSGWKGLKKKLPGWLLRKMVLKHMKKEFNAYLCAPYQLAQTDLTERVAQRDPLLEVDNKGNPIHDIVEVTDFHKKNVHPHDVLEALSKGTTKDEFEAGWDEYKNKIGDKIELSLETPWINSPKQPSAPELRLDPEDYSQPYNTEVDFTNAQKKPPFLS